MGINWDKAPKGSEFYGQGLFFKVDKYGDVLYWNGTKGWISAETWHRPAEANDYERRTSMLTQQWPETDERINAIGTNGKLLLEHYAQAKHDGDKSRYDLLPPVAIDMMAQVMTFGAKKYKPEGWRTVPDAVQRYQAALLRHSFAMLRGEVLDPESGLPHAAHAMCCAAFLAELHSSDHGA
jgi:hypothetical protein